MDRYFLRNMSAFLLENVNVDKWIFALEEMCVFMYTNYLCAYVHTYMRLYIHIWLDSVKVDYGRNSIFFYYILGRKVVMLNLFLSYMSTIFTRQWCKILSIYLVIRYRSGMNFSIPFQRALTWRKDIDPVLKFKFFLPNLFSVLII